MYQFIKPYWLNMTASKLIAHLKRGRYPNEFIRNAVNELQDIKNTKRKSRIRDTVSNKLWSLLLQPARSELGIVRTMKASIKREPKQTEALANKEIALQAYEDVLVRLIDRLSRVQKAGEHTPQQLVHALRKAGKQDIPNDGVHWTDYVSVKDKERIRLLFDRLPTPTRGRKKSPFERRISPEEHNIKRSALIKTLTQEIEGAERELEVAANSFDKERLEKRIEAMQHAQFILDNTPMNAPLPATWHGLVE